MSASWMSTLPVRGWAPDPPDFRDDSLQRDEVRELLALAPVMEKLPGEVDLREHFLDVEEVQDDWLSTVSVCAELYEYYERRSKGRFVSLSRPFLYRNARALAGVEQNCHVNLRSAMKSLVTFGSGAAQLWPDSIAPDCREPPPLMYAFAHEFRSIRYVRLDQRNQRGSQTLPIIKAFLAAGFPVAFGFSIPSSLTCDGDIPYRPTFDGIRGGQVGIAVGYDDRWMRSTRGALLIRTPWGRDWGDDGHARLPYSFVEHQMAADFWALLSRDWLLSGEFLRPPLSELPSGGTSAVDEHD